MQRFLNLVVFVVLVGGMVAVSSGQAGAQEPDITKALPFNSGTDYVCEIRLYPRPFLPSRGKFGYLGVTFYNGPNCTDGLVGTGLMFSEGATSYRERPPGFAGAAPSV